MSERLSAESLASCTETWWLRLRFMEGGWELVGQTQDFADVERWDDEIDANELRRGIDHEWTLGPIYHVVSMPYGARPLAQPNGSVTPE